MSAHISKDPIRDRVVDLAELINFAGAASGLSLLAKAPTVQPGKWLYRPAVVLADEEEPKVFSESSRKNQSEQPHRKDFSALLYTEMKVKLRSIHS